MFTAKSRLQLSKEWAEIFANLSIRRPPDLGLSFFLLFLGCVLVCARGFAVCRWRRATYCRLLERGRGLQFDNERATALWTGDCLTNERLLLFQNAKPLAAGWASRYAQDFVSHS